MSTAYNGQPILVASASNVGIASSTNATPIVVTTASAHGLQTGDFVRIASHSTNVAANGIRKITVLSATTFSLQTPDTGANVAGVGVGGATGTVFPFVTSVSVTEPDDGDAAAAASWNVGTETLSDRAAWSYYRLKGSQVLALSSVAHTTDDTNAAWTGGTNYAVTTWTEVTNSDLLSDVDVIEGDELDISFTSAYVSSATTAFSFALYAHAYDYGTAAAFASATRLPGSAIYYAPAGATVPLRLSWSGALSTIDAGLANGKGKALAIYVAAYNRGGAGSVMDFFGDRHMSLKVWR